jgi:hypothetical protein
MGDRPNSAAETHRFPSTILPNDERQRAVKLDHVLVVRAETPYPLDQKLRSKEKTLTPHATFLACRLFTSPPIATEIILCTALDNSTLVLQTESLQLP